MEHDFEILMMDALDGAINPANRALLNAYLAEHPSERAAFEHMLSVDGALRAAPLVAPSADFSQHVMTSVCAMPMARPLKTQHIAAIIAANSALIAVAWLMGGIALLALGMVVAQLPALQPVLALARGVGVFFADFFHLSSSLTRTLYRQPVFWLSMLAACVVIFTWLGVMAKVLMPARRFALR